MQMNPGTGSQAQEEIIIEAGRTEVRYWSDVWRYRELFYFLAWRDILVRYKQTAIGIAWSVLRPLATMVVFTLVFGTFAGLPSQGAPTRSWFSLPCSPGNSLPQPSPNAAIRW